ncbi:MAG: DUF4342 domain-containing protein [Clostridia bacterium]|nr:DUF4342 domain-containing protein [Clostridia bacterium]
MSVTLDKIDTIMERANVSYQEAKEALEKCDGNLVEALIDLEKGEKIIVKKKKVKQDFSQKGASAFDKIVDKIKEMHQQKFKIMKAKEIILSIPLTIAVLLILITFPFSAIILGLLLLIGYRISIKTNDSEIVVNDMVAKCDHDE